jgi:23S rRNA (guanosine2251-2'-O)-methyltransferase
VAGQTILYGIHPIREALRAGRPFTRLYLLHGRLDPKMNHLVQSVKAMGVSVHIESRPVLDRIAGTDKHQGIIAMIAAKPLASLDDLLSGIEFADSVWPPLLVVLDQIEDPQNLGAVIRTAEASGAHGVIIPERRSAGLTPAVAKVSAGALSHLPVAKVGNLRQAMDQLKKAGVWLLGLDVGATRAYWEVDWRAPVALIAGSEDKGLRPLIRDGCDELVALPMRGRVGSLNVSVAVGVVLYEIVRQRNKKSSEADSFEAGGSSSDPKS